jgi:hypothetical protein
VNLKEWPPANPLSPDEARQVIDRQVFPLLRVMNLADNDGWTLFDPAVNERQRLDILEQFEKIEKSIS